jgi:mannan endo-1,4-beta-mannosidase
LPRDKQLFDIDSPTVLRDEYYTKIFETLATNAAANGNLAGVNFWAFGGTSRPVKGRPFWQKGDDYSGDPPMEEQGLNSVFVGDVTTWNVIKKYSKLLD